ncbi:MAG: phospholipase D-like domain-containing protein [Planctomycetota bacterium]|jgi:cardiolipin synthase
MASILDPAIWPLLLGAANLAIALLTAWHALFHKQSERSAIIWLALIVFSPFIGSILYWLFGVNRIKRSARRAMPSRKSASLTLPDKHETAADIPSQWQAAMRVSRAVHDAPFTESNAIHPLHNGDEAYPRMLEAIERAQHSILMSSYIFDLDVTGRQFVNALIDAHDRGVLVRVLFDAVGLKYSWRATDRALKRAGVRTARFLPAISLTGPRFINLRNHRKLLCVDSEVAFTGGMNIRHANVLHDSPRHPTRDIHFEVQGPVINQLIALFSDDWSFASGESLAIQPWQTRPTTGNVMCRVLVDGPDENYKKLEWALIGAITSAEHNIRIITPYFLPGQIVTHALQGASLRGVRVEIIVPSRCNIPFFDWAMRATFKPLLEYGIEVYRSPPPFDHAKVFTADEAWSFVGSSNWDARSLELNFEANLECYSPHLCGKLNQIFEERKQAAEHIRCWPPKGYSPLWRARDRITWLLSPYL